VKERRKPARPWQSGGYGGGLPTFIGNGRRESARQGVPVDGRRLGPNQVVRFDERAMEAVLAFAGSGNRSCGGDRRRQRSVAQRHRRRQRSDGAGTPRGRPDASLLERGRCGSPCRDRPKLVPRRQARVQPGSDCRKMVRRHTGTTLVEFGVSASGPASGKACGVGAMKVARSVIERFTGARIVGRLQKSVRSIFSALPRGAERQTEAAWDSASRRHVLGEGESNESGNKGARSFARTVTGTASLFARPQGRESS